MYARSTMFLGSMVLVLFTGCVSTTQKAPAHARAIALEGEWFGTYYQEDIEQAYPMEMTVLETDECGFVVALGWPNAPVRSKTSGRAVVGDGSVSWSEDRLLMGRGIVLGGHYRAAFVNADTLAGTYEHDGKPKGFFAISRVKPGAVLARSEPSIRVAGR